VRTLEVVTAVATVGAAVGALWAAWQAKVAAQAARDGAALQRETWQEERLERLRAELVCYPDAQNEGSATLPIRTSYLVLVNRGLAAAHDVGLRLSDDTPVLFWIHGSEGATSEATWDTPAVPSGHEHRIPLKWADGVDRTLRYDVRVTLTWSDGEAARKTATQRFTPRA
jgi:hypothetical protein